MSDPLPATAGRRVVAFLDQVADRAVWEEMVGIIEGASAVLVEYDEVPSGPEIVGLIVGPHVSVDGTAADRLPNLVVVAASSTGFDHLAVEALSSRGAWVTNVAEYCTEEVADHALTLIVTLLRGVARADRSVRQGEWKSPTGRARRIAGTRLGLVGFGRIARALAVRAVSLGMDVGAFDPGVEEVVFEQLSVQRWPDIAQLLHESDVVSLHVPLTGATRHLLGARELARMRPGAFLVNVARGGLIDEAALCDAVISGQLGGVGLDVREEEPAAPGDPLVALDGVVVTPHMAWESTAARRSVFTQAARSVAVALDGDEPTDVIGRPHGSTPVAAPTKENHDARA
jgi:D-3-phosphoglycerate dehydrogenase